MDFITATVSIEGTGCYSQSRMHNEPRIKSDGPVSDPAYDMRTWRKKMNVKMVDGKERVYIPAHAMMQAITAAAKYSKEQIPGQGKATWTAKFSSGMLVPSDPLLDQSPDEAVMEILSQNVSGVRGDGKRVFRSFPVFQQWSSTFEVWILDPIITEQTFKKMLSMGGLVIGLGRFRPQNGGTNGRFVIKKIRWQDQGLHAA